MATHLKPISKKRQTIRISISLPVKLARRINANVKKRGPLCNRSEWLRDAVEFYLEALG
jgi:metal-responsive CopG/Arc/MetJ family transcriptional regulator